MNLPGLHERRTEDERMGKPISHEVVFMKWYCRYHVVIVPKYRHKAIFGALRRDIGKILRELCERSGIELVEGHAMPDHVHLCLSVPPKYSVANAVGG
jgi:putative transposase